MAFHFDIRRRRFRDTADESTTVFGRIGLTLFFFMFFAMGAGFCVLMGIDFIQKLGTYSWLATDATVTRSAIVRDRGGEHRFEVAYEYAVNDVTHTAESYDDPRGRGYTHAERAVLERLAARYPVGAACTAYVDPSNPNRAILVHPSLWLGLLIFLPLIFVAVGGGGIYFTWFGKAATTESIAGRGKSTPRSGKWMLRGLGVVFIAAGLLATHFILIGPLLRIRQAKSWTPVPATILASRVVSHRDDDGTTYSVDILYEYDVDGRKLRSNRYHFTTGSSSGRTAKQAIVHAHPPGKQVTAYVNPADPFDAVIDRGFPADMWFGLIPLIFCVAGAAAVVGSFYMKDKSRQIRGAAWLPAAATVEQAEDFLPGYQHRAGGRVALRRAATPLGKLLGMLGIALFWNAITGVFVGLAVNSHRAGNPEWFLTFFIIPFVLIGVGFIVAVFYQFLVLFNPSTVLEVSTAAPALGDTLSIDWRITGRADRITTLVLSLVGEEHATYRRGTDNVTDRYKFYDKSLFETSDKLAMLSGGHLEVLIPADVMHSFDAENNKITWTLKMTGDIRRWPDMNDEFRLVVQPMNPQEIARA